MPRALMMQSAGQCVCGEDSEKVGRETNSLILTLELILWLIRAHQ